MLIDRTYHGQQPDWRNSHHSKKGELFGIELEVEHPHDRQALADALDDFDPGSHPIPIAERDGSLNQHLGVEIICPPVPLADVTKGNGYMARLMKLLASAGARPEQPVGYGMHVNINIVDWDPKEKLVVQYLLNRFEVFGTVIGRRSGGQRTFGSYIPTLTFERMNGGALEMRTYPGDKHCAAWVRATARSHRAGTGAGSVMEVRFPRSSLDIEDLRRSIAYVYAVRDWVRAAPNHTTACMFYDWVLMNTRGNKPTTLIHGLFLNWLTKKNQPMYELLKGLGVPVVEGKRMEVMRAAVAKLTTPNLPATRIDTSDNAHRSEQTLRIGALLGKGANLQGEQAFGGGINASSVRAVN